ncbi:MAG: type I methionyl aminopeptidase [Acidobacteria bacterium]|nr:type I methionyl aminopeptidase [Acidobacteriota bacterium]NIM60796.1 type I methionyl aminopeptidase [Acidobacteriota bacterium]NIQ83481.1 type I methionyl aminopeptidase [Acidobacteriota bacterium]NIT09722.1 type I methionyl aminopeptidase [Acidobacteriota bacterium]
MSRLVLKSPAEIEIMHQANMILRRTLAALRTRIVPGVSTGEIDGFVEKCIREAGGEPAFKGYPHPSGGAPFPGTACVSVNDEIVHGVPSETRELRTGDIVSVDMGVLYKGYYGDSAETYAVGEVDEQSRELLEATRESLQRGIDAARVGNRVSDIGHAVQTHVEAHGFSVVREFVGHGIGASLHEDPQVPNFGSPGRRERLVEGMVLAIEPMVNIGAPDVMLSADDGWTARTRDGSRSAHFEVCVAITKKGPQILGEPVEG